MHGETGYGKVMINSPVPCFIAISKCGFGNLDTDAHMIKLVLHKQQTALDDPKALAICQLYKEQAVIYINKAKRPNHKIYMIRSNTTSIMMKI